jgi:FixJ family two-component response regulator
MLNPPTSIAVVDDDLPVRKALVRLLSARCLSAATYPSAQKFIDSLANAVPQCLIVDVQMPEMTGLELQHHLDRAGIRIPTVVITAYDEPGIRDQCLAAGATAFLVKPLDEERLIAVVAKALASAPLQQRHAPS